VSSDPTADADHLGMALDEISSRRLGTALRDARVTAGLSRHELAARTGCSSRQLRAFERGEAQPNDAQLERLAMACSQPVDTLLPPRGEAPVALEDGHLLVGATSSPLRSDEPPTDEVLRSYLGVVYELRDSKPGARIPLRDRDLDALATALGSDPEFVETRLVELMDVTREEAAALRAALIRRRILLPAASIAIGASMVVGGAKLVGGGGSAAPTGAAVQSPGAGDIRIGTAAATSTAQPEIGEAASVEAQPEIGDAISASLPVVDAAPGDPAVVTRTTPPS
jgi:transcriptional regulator with XRE-family HTH domain